MDGETDPTGGLLGEIAAAREQLAVLQCRLDQLCIAYADARAGQAGAGAYAADELAVVLSRSTWSQRRALSAARRVRSGMPLTAVAAREGRLDGEQVRVVDDVARLARRPETRVALDERAAASGDVEPRQLKVCLQRLLARLEPDGLAHRHRIGMDERKVTVAQGASGMGYVTGEVSALDAAAIDAHLRELAWSVGAGDKRTEQQRRSDIFTGLLLSRLDVPATDADPVAVEQVDLGTGELVATGLTALDAEGEVAKTAPIAARERSAPRVRIGVVVPLSSLLGADERPGELSDRSAAVPVEVVRALAAQPDTLFTRLLTDDGGRLLDTTELGRFPSAALAEAVRLRAGTCEWFSCSRPADACDVDHHEPAPEGPTSGSNLGAQCRHNHRGKTFAGLACRRQGDVVEWTLPGDNTYRRADEPLPV